MRRLTRCRQAPSRVRRAFFERGWAAAEANLAIQDAVKANKLDLFAELLNNQPQLVLTTTRRDRSGLTGPDETSVTILGVKWADEPEFLGEVDHEVSSRLGLIIKVPSKEGD